MYLTNWNKLRGSAFYFKFCLSFVVQYVIFRLWDGLELGNVVFYQNHGNYQVQVGN